MAGQECLASELAYSFARFAREPRVNISTRPAEVLACQCLRNGRCSFDEMQAIMDLLLSDGQAKRVDRPPEGAIGPVKVFGTGAYIFGGVAGIRTAMRNFPSTSRLLARIVRAACSEHVFTSTVLFQNVRTKPRADLCNAKTPNLAIPCSVFQGGAIWVQSDGGDVPMTIEDQDSWGFCHEVANGPVLFDAQRWHCTNAWDGLQLLLVAFSVDAFDEMSSNDIELLACHDFNLPGRRTAPLEDNVTSVELCMVPHAASSRDGSSRVQQNGVASDPTQQDMFAALPGLTCDGPLLKHDGPSMLDSRLGVASDPPPMDGPDMLAAPPGLACEGPLQTRVGNKPGVLDAPSVLTCEGPLPTGARPDGGPSDPAPHRVYDPSPSCGLGPTLVLSTSVAPLVIEVFAGSANLSKACQAAGFRVLAIDHDASRTSFPILPLDLTCQTDQARLAEIIDLEMDHIALAHFSPPCGTASAARDKPVPGMTDPPLPLRSLMEPMGLATLRGLDLVRVEAANALYQCTGNLAALVADRGRRSSVENPVNSLAWLCDGLDDLRRRADSSWVEFARCMHGGTRDKCSGWGGL